MPHVRRRFAKGPKGRREQADRYIHSLTRHADIGDQKGIIGEASASLDPSRYYIVVPALIGNGESVSPSNRPDLRGRFPVVSFFDNVRAQHALVHDRLGVAHVLAVVGFSMGGSQAYQWAVQYPDYVDVVVPICASARTALHNNVFLEGVKAALVAARGGVSCGIGRGQTLFLPAGVAARDWTAAERDVGLRALGRVYAGWGFSQAFYRERYYDRFLGEPDLDAFLQRFWEAWALRHHPDDMLLMLQTWQLGDIAKTSPALGGDLHAALQSITCRVLVAPGKTDLYFPPEDSASEVANMRPGVGTLAVIPSIWGHWAGGMGDSKQDWAFLDRHMADIFEEVKAASFRRASLL